MATKLQLQQRQYNKGHKEFQFALYEASEGYLELHTTPDGFIDNGATTYARHGTYKTVLRKAASNEYTFYKEAKNFLKNVYENSGISALVILYVWRYNNSTHSYDVYPTASKVDLSTYIVNEIGVSVQVIDTEFNEKVLNRDTVKIDLLKRVTVEGVVVAPFTTNEFIIPDTSIDLEGHFTGGGAGFESLLIHVVPILETAGSEFIETQTPATGAGDVDKWTGSFFNQTTRTRILSIVIDLRGDFIGTGTPFDPSVVTVIKILDSSENIITTWAVGDESATGVNTMAFSFQKTLNITLNAGESMNLQSTISDTDKKFEYSTADIDISEIYTGTGEKSVTGFEYYEAMLRALQLISDTNNPIQSTKLGRTDSALTTYPADGELGYITQGRQFRSDGSFPLTIPVTFRELFQSLSSIFRLGMSIEDVGGVWKCIIEDLDYFFDANVVIDLSDRVREEDIEKSVLPDMFFNSAEFGYNKFEYENNAGLYEFNTKSSWTIEQSSIDNGLNIISKYRADGQGIRLLVNAPTEVDYDASEDVKGDEDIFLTDCVRDGAGFKARTNEGFDYIGGSVYAASSFNIFYSPMRNLLRYGGEIKAGLLKALSSIVRWQTTEKNSTLVSRLSTETSNVSENADIVVNDLPDTKYLLEEYDVEATITTAELNAFDTNKNGLIKLSDTKYGWVNEFKPNTKDQKATFKLLRCNLSIVTPIEI